VSLAVAQLPDLVLMDIRLAGNTDGIEARRGSWSAPASAA
jgi:CheY-like chemotaxis protein